MGERAWAGEPNRSRGCVLEVVPCRKVLVAAKVLMATKWTHREAAVVKREKRVAMPSKLGINWG